MAEKPKVFTPFQDVDLISRGLSGGRPVNDHKVDRVLDNSNATYAFEARGSGSPRKYYSQRTVHLKRYFADQQSATGIPFIKRSPIYATAQPEATLSRGCRTDQVS